MKKISLLTAMLAQAKSLWLLAVLVMGIAPSLMAQQRVGNTGQFNGIGYRVAEVRPDGKLLLEPTLDGVWVTASGNMDITISGNSGVLTRYNPTNALGIDAKNKGYLNAGVQYFRNLRSTGNLTWSGQWLAPTTNTRSPNVVIGTQWVDARFTLSADGRTLTLTDLGNQAITFDNYTRRQ